MLQERYLNHFEKYALICFTKYFFVIYSFLFFELMILGKILESLIVGCNAASCDNNVGFCVLGQIHELAPLKNELTKMWVPHIELNVLCKLDIGNQLTSKR